MIKSGFDGKVFPGAGAWLRVMILRVEMARSFWYALNLRFWAILGGRVWDVKWVSKNDQKLVA
jgi:hypothetical protein